MRATQLLHPYLFALYPAWFLYVSNLGELELLEIVPSVIALVAVATGLVLIGRVALGSFDRSAFLVAASLVFLFSYEAIHITLWESGFPLGRHRYLLPLGGLALPAVGFLSVRLKRESLEAVNRILSAVATLLVVLATLSAAPQLLGRIRAAASVPSAESGSPLRLGADPPDIYYIVLDGYARSDVLASRYGGDDRALLERLRSLGFFVATESRANYCQSILSLASSLNFRYLDDLAEGPARDTNDHRPPTRLIQSSRAVEMLRGAGYRIVAFATGYGATELRSADIFKSSGRSLSLFEHQLLGMTPLTLLTRRVAALGGYDKHRQRILFTLEALPRSTSLAGPKFVFGHLMAPHQPFVLNAAGEPVEPGYAYSLWNPDWVRRNPEAYRQGYRAQAEFVAAAIGRTLDRILAADPDAVIILQSDHGPALGLDLESADSTDLEERLGILNAYRLPGVASDSLYPSISPVNTFRLVFNEYFATDYPLLPDRSFFSTWSRPYRFSEVPRAVR